MVDKLRAVSDWTDDDNSSFIDKFFMRKEDFPWVYSESEFLHQNYLDALGKNEKDAKFFPSVIEQLSPKGLALLSYLYSEKDKVDSQPLIASTVESFENIAQLMSKSPLGTQVTVIFQATDIGEVYDFLRVGPFHWTVCKFEQTESGLKVYQIDSTNNQEKHLFPCQFILKQLLGNTFQYFTQKDILKPSKEPYSGHVKPYQCGIFATKDARKISKAPDFSDNIIPGTTEYELHSKYFKAIQSDTFFSDYLSKHGKEIVNRKGDTLTQMYEKYGVNYIQEANIKHNERVIAFLEKYKDEPEYIRHAVEKFDAANMNMDRLIADYCILNPSIFSPRGKN